MGLRELLGSDLDTHGTSKVEQRHVVIECERHIAMEATG
jgi:hypothetical protein